MLCAIAELVIDPDLQIEPLLGSKACEIYAAMLDAE